MKKILRLSILISLIIVSCKKNQLDGKSTIKGKVVHHTKTIGNATVFIKFNSRDFPGEDTTLYDAKVKADANGNYTIKCYKGHYYLFGYGLDNAINPPKVVGGIPVNIRNNETVEADVAVTED